MATKRDLIEAQGFSRRRLLSAFTGGAPGGVELEPARPLRAVIAGVALAAMVAVGGVFWGMMRPGLPAGWDNNQLILVKDTGTRYVSINQRLHPVKNTASARLLLDGKSKIITTSSATIANKNVATGPAIGIDGAPDALPKPRDLLSAGWSSCRLDNKSWTWLSDEPATIAPKNRGVTVTDGEKIYVITGGTRYLVEGENRDGIVREVGLTSNLLVRVSARWLNLFEEGTPLQSFRIDPRAAGKTLPNSNLKVGQLIRKSPPSTDHYIVRADGSISKVSKLAQALYLLGERSSLTDVVEVTASDIVGFTDGEPAGKPDWPTEPLVPIDSTVSPCAVLTASPPASAPAPASGGSVTVLGTATPDAIRTATADLGEIPAAAPAGGDGEAKPVTVQRGGGALVRTGRGMTAGDGYLIDELGIAYPVPVMDEETITRLGYEVEDVAYAPAGWLEYFAVGPALSMAAAQGGVAPSGPTP